MFGARPLLKCGVCMHRVRVLLYHCPLCTRACVCLFLCTCVPVPVCGGVWLCVPLCGCVCLCVPVCGCAWRCVAVCGCVPLCASVCLYVPLCVCLHVPVHACACLCVPVRAYVCLCAPVRARALHRLPYSTGFPAQNMMVVVEKDYNIFNPATARPVSLKLLDLGCAPYCYGVYGFNYIDLVSSIP